MVALLFHVWEVLDYITSFMIRFGGRSDKSFHSKAFFAFPRITSNSLGNSQEMQKASKRGFYLWEVLDSNQRPPPCQGDALNQLS